MNILTFDLNLLRVLDVLLRERNVSRAAERLALSQPAVSQQLKFAPGLDDVHPETLLDAAAPILRSLAIERGYRDLAIFGSVARKQAGPDSDIDLLVTAPPHTGGFAFADFKSLLERVLGREVDLISWGGLKPVIDDDIRREAVML